VPSLCGHDIAGMEASTSEACGVASMIHTVRSAASTPHAREGASQNSQQTKNISEAFSRSQATSKRGERSGQEPRTLKEGRATRGHRQTPPDHPRTDAPMPSLTIKPPKPPSSNDPSSSPPPPAHPFTFSAPPPSNVSFIPPQQEPVAPAYSPITPKVVPAVLSSQHGRFLPPPGAPPQAATTTMLPPTEVPPAPAMNRPTPATAEYIPQPPPQPFSSKDSTDAIALRAAISALQFQKKKAQDDLRTLEATKKEALQDPQRFKEELVSGRLREQRPQFGGVQAILDQSDSDEDEEEEEAGPGASRDDEIVMNDAKLRDTKPAAELSHSHPQSQDPVSESSSPSKQKKPNIDDKPVDFSRIPGPQNVVRMPYINWEKYHVVGEPLERMHEHQRKWPGNFAYGHDQGREYAVAAPYSPFTDVLGDGQEVNGGRKDSLGGYNSSALTTPTVSEHPMETRRSSKMSQH
jgi:hypothetical protein